MQKYIDRGDDPQQMSYLEFFLETYEGDLIESSVTTKVTPGPKPSE